MTSGAFTLIRLAMPQRAPDEDPSTSRLGPEGIAAARQLSSLVPHDTYVVASPEPKASATALLITGREPVLDLRLSEVARPSRWNTLHRRHVRRYLSGHYVTGWEDQEAVVGRVGDALADHRDRAGQQRLVVVGHGISAALWVATTLGLDAVRWWTSLHISDAWDIDLTSLCARRIEAGG